MRCSYQVGSDSSFPKDSREAQLKWVQGDGVRGRAVSAESARLLCCHCGQGGFPRVPHPGLG